MTQAKHTPGPWINRSNRDILTADKLCRIADIANGPSTDEERLGNAILIAAAPDLLEALRAIATQSVGDDWTPIQALAFIKQHAKDAIAKATGGAA